MPATGLMCFYMQKVRSDGTLEEHHPLDLLFPSIYFYDVILLRAFLQQQTDEWTAATAREKKKLESDRHSHWVCIRNGKPFSKCWIIILFYFMRCIGESIIIFTFTFRAGEGRDISQRKSVWERERVYCSVFQVVSTVSRRVWFGRQPTQICETCRHALGILPFSIQCRMLQKTNRNYTHMHKHQAPSTIIIIIIMLLICRYVMNEWVEKKIYSAKIVSTTDIKMKKNWRSRESHRLQVVQRN